MRLDVLIRRGMVLDGQGRAPVAADVGIAGDRIAALAPDLGEREAGRVIDASGLVVAPGFIDIHAHGDLFPLLCPEAPARLHDGVTLEVLGNCGESPFPQSPAMLAARADSRERHGLEVDWASLRDYARRHDAIGCGINRCSLVGHGNVRAAVMGEADRAPTAEELEAMCREVDRAMAEGAVGLSTGLIYAPGMYAASEEIEALCATTARHAALYASHIRSEGSRIEEAVAEFLAAGRRTGVRLQLSHVKVSGQENWPKIDAVLRALRAARADGVDVACDRYPYTASWTSLSAFLPGWAREGGREAMVARLTEPASRGRLVEWLGGRASGAPWTTLVLATAGCERWACAEGRSVGDLAAEAAADPAELALDILADSQGRASVMLFGMSEDNLERWLREPYVAVGSDSSSRGAEGPTAEGKPHPRSYGTACRFLGRYVRDRGLMSVAEGVRRLTGLPASRLGLPQRGVLREGAFADVVVFDPQTVADRATYDCPQQYSVGVQHVLVNGAIAVADGELTGERNGRFLKRGEA